MNSTDMNRINITSLDVQHENDFREISTPSWSQIETAIRSLEAHAGSIDIWENDETGLVVVVRGEAGVYSVDVMEGQKRAAMLVPTGDCSASSIEVFGEKYPASQVVRNVDVVIDVVAHLLTTTRYLDVSPDYRWVFRDIST